MNKIKRRRILLADMSLLLVAIIWGGTYIVVKNALLSINLFQLLTLRFVSASFLMYIFFYKQIGKLTKKDFLNGSIVGIILFFGFSTLNFALQFTTASKQGFLVASYVVIVPILYWILYKKRPKFKFFIGSGLTIIGIGLVTLQKGFTLGFGDTISLISAIFFAMHIISIEYFAKNMNIYKLAFVQIFTVGILSTIAAILTGSFNHTLNSEMYLSIIYLSLISTLLCFIVQNIAQKYTNSSHASIIMSLESVFAAIFGIVFLNEVLTPTMIVGCVIILIAVLIIELDISFLKINNKK